MARPFLAVAAALVLGFCTAPAALAQSPLSARLANERLGWVQPGTYQAGDNTEFTIDREDGHYLMRFVGEPEVFVLYGDHASLGGRVLKYDSGKVALQVAGWGGMTLYTDKKPGGLPAVRIGDADPTTLPQVSLDDVKQAAADEAAHLAYVRKLHIGFEADWDRLADDANMRALCFDALTNAARGIDRFAAGTAGLRALQSHVETVLVITSAKPTLARRGEQLVVTFDPTKGFAGRASSRAIDRALHTLFRVR